MCSPDLKVKAKKAMDMFLSDEDGENDERSKLKVMNYITGNNKNIENAVIDRTDDLYVAK